MNRRRRFAVILAGETQTIECYVLEEDTSIPTGETLTVACLDTASYTLTINENSTLETTS